MRIVPVLLTACTPPTLVDPTGNPVDETGYLDVNQVFYSSATVLDQTQAMTLVGLPGALDPADGALTVEGPDGPADEVLGPDETGAFRVQLWATAGDELTLTYTPAGQDPAIETLTLDDALDNLFAPQQTSSSFLITNTDGTVTVEFAALSGIPPYIAYARLGGFPVVSEDGSAVVLQAGPGDEVCVFSYDPTTGDQSPYTCGVVQ